MEYVRWVMVRKRDLDAPAPGHGGARSQAMRCRAEDLVMPEGLDFSATTISPWPESRTAGRLRGGREIDHVDGVTIEEAEHMMATRLWQNTSKVHFDATPARMASG
jgi:2-methylfumaryl-CoA hydratase